MQAPGRRRVERAERHYAAAQRRELADALGGVLERAERANSVVGEGVAGVGRDHPATGAHEQVGAQGALELADLLRHRGLRDPQRLGRGGERAQLRGSAEAAELLQRQKLCLWFRQASNPSLRNRGSR